MPRAATLIAHRLDDPRGLVAGKLSAGAELADAVAASTAARFGRSAQQSEPPERERRPGAPLAAA